ncbi:hypothetical protein NKR19_g8216 [Coniochaeta hoffmannii]|uniref:Uncharacterized protein n=1 Tax=Coniochaeta hoffmannii TaxID=91930 RepID=A0AA38RGH7_9PEZI|nr:hypothetical protein NKR19_g8216 [Coniochaeta hoffmannii]
MYFLPITTLLTLLLATSPSLSTPTPAHPATILPRGAGVSTQASDIIAAIMPSSTSCASAASGPYASDCRTNVQAAEPLIAAMKAYNLTTAGQIAAVLALVGFESVDMRYKHNVYPGTVGQGTSAMLMPENVRAYAGSLPELAGGLAAAGGDPGKVLELVVDDKYNFGAAPWWLTSKCGAAVVEGLRGASEDGWKAYMGCVGVDAGEPKRVEYWARAKKAFGLE